MLDWLKPNRNYPEFWKNYLKEIDEKSSRFVVLSLEVQLDQKSEKSIASIGAVTIIDNKILVADCFEAAATEKILVDDVQNITVRPINLDEKQSVEKFVNFISNATLVGHRIDIDLQIVNQVLKNMNCGEIKNQAIDLEVMFRKWKNIADNKQIEVKSILDTFEIEQSERTSAVYDALDLGLIFLKLKKRLGF
ncbi:MAG: hypothetical protein RLZZ312_867 [Bacteroidota bacterium]|jgi:DNA polymerase-3 subunit epsilon